MGWRESTRSWYWGDVESNPGPPCAACNTAIRINTVPLQCGGCGGAGGCPRDVLGPHKKRGGDGEWCARWRRTRCASYVERRRRMRSICGWGALPLSGWEHARDMEELWESSPRIQWGFRRFSGQSPILTWGAWSSNNKNTDHRIKKGHRSRML